MSSESPDWVAQWRAKVGAQELGHIVICPPWLADNYDPATTVIIEPAMAFGTGEHETTRGVTRLLKQVIRPGDFVADLGAGSAVLAIAAVKLGAARAAAIEVDADAIGNAEENVERNGVADRVKVIEGDAKTLLQLVSPVRVILANIISSVLLDLLPVMAQSITPDGQVILSGILAEERQTMLDAIEREGWQVQAEDAEGMWWSVVINRK